MTRDPLPVEKLYEALEHAKRIIEVKMMKNKGSLVTTHEAFGKVYEEVLEAAEEMHKNNPQRFKAELIDIMVACAWGYASELP